MIFKTIVQILWIYCTTDNHYSMLADTKYWYEITLENIANSTLRNESGTRI